MKAVYRVYPWVVILLFLILSGCGNLPENKQTELELYLTATEAYELLKKDNKTILFVDVRTHDELTKEGTASFVDAHIPIFMKGDDKKVIFNNGFISAVEKRIKEKELNNQNTIILICRQGNRSAKAVDTLAKAGYQKVYTVVDGTNGWKDNKLPWSDKMNE